jgi:hypothetical protein
MRWTMQVWIKASGNTDWCSDSDMKISGFCVSGCRVNGHEGTRGRGLGRFVRMTARSVARQFFCPEPKCLDQPARSERWTMRHDR